jgi:hypothetical protein
MENTPTTDNAPIPDTSPIVDNYRVTITKGDVKTGHWVSGSVNENPTYTFHAKVFDVGSMYGINGGQISKLMVYHRGHQVVDYDRGWDQRPATRDDNRAVELIVGAFKVREEQLNPEKSAKLDSHWHRALCRSRKNEFSRER